MYTYFFVFDVGAVFDSNYCMFLLFIFMGLSDSDVVLSCMHLLTIGVKGTRRKNATSELMYILMYTKVMSFFSTIFKRSNCHFIIKSCQTCTKLLHKHFFLFAVHLFILLIIKLKSELFCNPYV